VIPLSLFDQILGAVNNPGQQGSMDQLGGLVNMAQQVSSQYGMDPAMTQTVMSMLGGAVQSGLQNHQDANGLDATQGLVQQLGSSATADPNAIASLIPVDVQQQTCGSIAQRTGLDPGMVQSMLPNLIPVAMNMLQGGAAQGGSGNPLLNTFLDKNHDGNLDMGDAMGLAMQFMQNH
jgi:hypothetical protein